jgi:O-antigen/teichoic acid export membrane protein
MAGSQALFDTTQEIQRARRHSADFTRTAVARSVVGMALSIGAAYYFRRGEAVLFAIAAGFFVLGARYVFVHRATLSVREALKGPSRRFFAYGMPLAISGLVFSGNSTLARVMVANALGSAAAGQFGAALDVTGQLTTMVAGSVCSIMAPAAIRAYGAHGPAAARTELATGLELFLGILAPTVIGLATVARPFAQVVSGHEFAGALGALIPLLAVSRGLNALSQFYLHLGFQIVEKPARQVVCGCVTLAINLVLNFALTREFGVAGAAAALALADLCGVAVSFLLLRPVFPMPFPLAKVARIAAATVAMALVCEVVMNVTQGPAAVVLFVTVAAGIAAYAAMVTLFDICGVRRALWPRGRRFVLDQLRMRRV